MNSTVPTVNATSTASFDKEVPQVNMTQGYVGSIVDWLIQEHLHQDSRQQRTELLLDGQ